MTSRAFISDTSRLIKWTSPHVCPLSHGPNNALNPRWTLRNHKPLCFLLYSRSQSPLLALAGPRSLTYRSIPISPSDASLVPGRVPCSRSRRKSCKLPPRFSYVRSPSWTDGHTDYERTRNPPQTGFFEAFSPDSKYLRTHEKLDPKTTVVTSDKQYTIKAVVNFVVRAFNEKKGYKTGLIQAKITQHVSLTRWLFLVFKVFWCMQGIQVSLWCAM